MPGALVLIVGFATVILDFDGSGGITGHPSFTPILSLGSVGDDSLGTKRSARWLVLRMGDVAWMRVHSHQERWSEKAKAMIGGTGLAPDGGYAVGFAARKLSTVSSDLRRRQIFKEGALVNCDSSC